MIFAEATQAARLLLAMGLIYIVPGFGVAAIFSDRTRWNPLVWVWGSFVITPIVATNIGFFGIRSPSAVFVGALLLAICFAGLWTGALLRRFDLSLQLRSAPEAGTRLPRLIAIALVVVFAVCVHLADTSLLHDSLPGVFDRYCQLSETTSVAVTGIPPRHYFFPQVPLSFYYYDFVLPGLLAGLLHPTLTVAQALVVHVLIEAVLLGLTTVALAFRLVPKPWAALAMVYFLTLGGGFDFWVGLATGHLQATDLEWWPPWTSLVTDVLQISLPLTLALWVPHHWMAAHCVLAGLAIIACVDGDRRTRLVLLGVMLAFMAGCSVFASIGLGLGLVLWTLLGLSRFKEPWGGRDALVVLAIGGCLSLVLLDTYLFKPSMLGTPLEHIGLGIGAWPSTSEEWLLYFSTKLRGLPGFAAYLFLDGGITIVVFFAWLWIERRRILVDRAAAWIACIGIATLPMMYLVRSVGANDLGMRGIIPAQIAWAVASAWLLSSKAAGKWHGLLIGIVVCGELLAFPTVVFQAYRNIEANLNAAPLPEFVRWLNRETPLDAPVIIVNDRELKVDTRHLIERVRLIDPRKGLANNPANDRQYVQLTRLQRAPALDWDLSSPAGACHIVDQLHEFLSTEEVYLLAKLPPRSVTLPGERLPPSFGKPVFHDEKRAIYRVDCAALPSR